MLGIASRRELLQRITSSELTEWMAYKLIEEQDREAEEKKAAAKRKHRK